jgi:hypothetical protein
VKSYQYPAAVRERSRAKGVPKLLLIALATYADDNGECFPSYAELVRVTGLSLRSVQRQLKEIPSSELMIVERGRAVGHSTKYRIMINCSQVDDSRAANCGQTDHSQNGNCSQTDHRTMVKNDVNYGQADHLTTKELPIEPPTARKRAPSPSSVASESNRGSAAPTIPLLLQTPKFLEAWRKYDDYRQKGRAKKNWTRYAKEAAIEKCSKLGSDRAVEAIQHSMANGWDGIFEAKDNGRANERFDPNKLPKL